MDATMDVTMITIVVVLDRDRPISGMGVVDMATMDGTQDQGRHYSATAAGIAGGVEDNLVPTQRIQGNMTVAIVDGVGLHILPLAVIPRRIDTVVAILHTLLDVLVTHRLWPPVIGERNPLWNIYLPDVPFPRLLDLIRVFIPEVDLTHLSSLAFLQVALHVLIGLPAVDDHPERLPLLKFHVCALVVLCLFVLILSSSDTPTSSRGKASAIGNS